MSSASHLLAPRVTSHHASCQCTFLGESLVCPQNPRFQHRAIGLRVEGVKQSSSPSRKLSAASLCSCIWNGSCQGSASRRCVSAASVAETGAPTETEAAQERAELGAGARTLLLWQARAKPGSSRKAPQHRPDQLETSPASEHPLGSEQTVATAKAIKAPSRRKPGALLDSIRTKVLNASEDVVVKGAPESNLKARKPVAPHEDRRLGIGVGESASPKIPGPIQNEVPVLWSEDGARKGGRAVGGSPRGSVNGTASKVAPPEGGADVISFNGALWAVAAAASKIANGGVVEQKSTGAGEALPGGVSERGALRLNRRLIANGASFHAADLRGSEGAEGPSEEQSSAVMHVGGLPKTAAERGAGLKAKSKKAGPASASGQGTAFEDGVMEALRKNMIEALREKRPAGAGPPSAGPGGSVSEAGSSGALGELERPDVSGTEEESGRTDSGLSASTSGRDAAPARSRARKAKVSLATEILIEQALSEGEAPKEAPVRKTRKRVQKVVVVEGPATGEGEKPKRVRKRVRVRSAEVEGGPPDLGGAENKSTDAEEDREGVEVSEGSKGDSRSFRARRGKLPALGAATSPVETVGRERMQAGQISRPVQKKENSGSTVPAIVGSMILGAASGNEPTAVQSLGGLGPKLATQSVNKGSSSKEGSRKGGTEHTLRGRTGSLKPATSQVPLGPIQALRASAPSISSSESGTVVKGPKVATNRAGSGPVSLDVEEGFRGPKVATNRVVGGSLDGMEAEESVAEGPKLATMKVPLGPIAALRAAASQPANDLAPAVRIADEVLEVGPIQVLRSSGRHAVSAVTKRSAPLDYLSDLEEEEEEFEIGEGELDDGPIRGLRSSGGRAGVGSSYGAAALDYLSDLEEEDGEGIEEETAETPVGGSVASGVQGAQNPLKNSYYSDHLMESHSKTKFVWGRQNAHAKEGTFLEQLDYSIEPPEAEKVAEEMPIGGQRKRRRGMRSESPSRSGESVNRGTGESSQGEQKPTGGAKPSSEFLLMYATWRDLSEGRLDPAGYEVVSEKTGAVIGVVSALEPLTPAAEKEMEETGLQLHTGLLRMTAVAGFVDEYESERRTPAGSAGVPSGIEQRGFVESEAESASALFGGSEGKGAGDAKDDEELEREELLNALREFDGEEGVQSEGDESDSDWEELEDDTDSLASLDELKAALGGSDSEEEDEGGAGAAQREYAIPVIGEYIADVSVKERRIRVTLPGSLDRISRRPAILRGLGMALYKYCSGKNQSVKTLAEVKEKARGGRAGDGREQKRSLARQNSTVHPQITYIPTEKELLTDGREDILEDIELVGGFAAATNALGLSRQKRPIGFWENKLHLDAEIELFNYSRWTKRTNSETGEVYWVNLLNDMVAREKPPPPDSLTPPLPVSYREEDVDTACMPKRKDVQEAGRWDLHHAIVSHGGYTAVGRELGRQTPPRLPEGAPRLREQSSKYAFPEMLVSAIRKVMKEKNLTKLPSIRDFKEMGRNDIVLGFRRHGGVLAVAEMMNVEPKVELKPGPWTLESAAAALSEYVNEKAARTGQPRSMPTLKELQQAGRSNLRYVIQHFGQKVMAEQLGLPPNLSSHEKKRLRAAQTAAEGRAGQSVAELRAEAELRAIRSPWTLKLAAAALKEYVDEKAARTGQPRAMPTLKELLQAGQGDLRYVILHFGHKVMAEQLGLPPNVSTHEKNRMRAAQVAAEIRAGQSVAELRALWSKRQKVAQLARLGKRGDGGKVGK
ncbi:hypothetical protein KFL_002720045 [Klebsormidium nitens]|uniref:Uncharacterized protein n=1 Tax=Klebsormidium nitens TaxID=105231 RepID=A0A1Y1IAH9_KLENI|nr:hypothetical protein KFL_002720045 [Klebsormidium nitens]|eukprot:GAQ86131.1 hypothetical protein KFL_002720045 [Klebsormidium nitens]